MGYVCHEIPAHTVHLAYLVGGKVQSVCKLLRFGVAAAVELHVVVPLPQLSGGAGYAHYGAADKVGEEYGYAEAQYEHGCTYLHHLGADKGHSGCHRLHRGVYEHIHGIFHVPHLADKQYGILIYGLILHLRVILPVCCAVRKGAVPCQLRGTAAVDIAVAPQSIVGIQGYSVGVL